MLVDILEILVCQSYSLGVKGFEKKTHTSVMQSVFILSVPMVKTTPDSNYL